jgi:plastocyanin
MRDRATRMVVTSLALALASCGGSGSKAQKVHVGLGDDFKVVLDRSTVTAGKIEMSAKNSGSMEHEVVVYKLALKDLPIKPDSSVDEDQVAEDVKQGEIEHVAARSNKSGTFDLKPGTYAVFCNLETKMSDGSTLLHYPKGMKAELVVG